MDKEGSKMMKKRQRRTDTTAEASTAAASLLTDDLIVEIFSRLPARSVHRFKCVCTAWRDLIADPAHLKKLPQTIGGFFYATYRSGRQFASFSGEAARVDPSLPFLQYKYTDHVDTCNGLLLCLCHNKRISSFGDRFWYVVCNPATKRWVELPTQLQERKAYLRTARLAFDPAVSSHFHVLEFEQKDLEQRITGVNIYSSKTGAWNHVDSSLVENISLGYGIKSVFLGSMLHLLGVLEADVNKAVLVAVDMGGEVWKTIGLPRGVSFGTIGLSQGLLHYANTIQDSVTKLWCLEDYEGQEWVLKHSVGTHKLLGITGEEYRVVAIHPDCDILFLDSCQSDTLASFDLGHMKFHRIVDIEENHSGKYLPYVPLFSESLADEDGH